MSSQGPSAGTETGFTPVADTCFLTGKASQVPPGYPFDRTMIRDASDWIKYKKQTRIYSDSKLSKSKDPWFVRGNDFRLEWLNGENKCESCEANAFSGSISFLIKFFTGPTTILQDLTEHDDAYQEIDATGFDFYIGETNYGNGNNGGIFINSNNSLHFGNGDHMCCQDTFSEYINESTNIPKFAFSVADRFSFMISQSSTQTVGDIQYIAIIQSWADLDNNDVPTADTQIRMIRNTNTGEQWLEYRIHYINDPQSNIFGIDLLSGNQQEEYTPSIQPNTGFTLLGNSTGTSWTFQPGVLINVY